MLITVDSFSSFLIAHNLILVASEVKYPETCHFLFCPLRCTHCVRTIASLGCGKNSDSRSSYEGTREGCGDGAVPDVVLAFNSSLLKTSESGAEIKIQ